MSTERMPNPAMLVNGAMEALMAVNKAIAGTGLDGKLLALSHLRASQINGCSMCVEMHARDLKKAGEKDERLFAVAAWREAPYFSDAERAALALTEALTRIADNAEPVPDAIWDAAAEHFDETQLGALVLDIATINLWNRLNVATQQVVGEHAG